MEFDLNIIKVLVPWLVSFIFGFFITPVVLSYLYKFQLWRKDGDDRKKVLLYKSKEEAEKIEKVINKTDKDKKTPRMGGLVIVVTVLFTTFFFWLVSFGIFGNPSGKMDFLSRDQTWLPLAAFIFGGILGFIDDYLTVKNIKIGKFIGFPLKYRIFFVSMVAFLAALWFYYKLGYSQVFIPFYGNYEMGLFFIPFFMLVFLSLFGTTNIDGLDGLAGGIMAVIFTAMGFIAFFQNQINISAFSFVIVGAILAFLWFNISPAKFYMSEVGYLSLVFSLVIISFLTDTVFLLPIIAFILFVNLIVTVLQVFSIRLFNYKIFRAAPLHHHFELKGWSESQIILRYWIISIIFAIFGTSLAVIVFSDSIIF